MKQTTTATVDARIYASECVFVWVFLRPQQFKFGTSTAFFHSICLSVMCRCVSVCLCVWLRCFLSRLHALRTHALTQDSTRKLCNVNLLRIRTYHDTPSDTRTRTSYKTNGHAECSSNEPRNLPDWFICFFTKLNSQRALSNGSFTIYIHISSSIIIISD